MKGLNDRRIDQLERRASGDHTEQTAQPGAPKAPADIVEFVFGAEWLDLPSIYPRQLLLLKLLTLRADLLTPEDHEVLAEWAKGFHLASDDDASGWVGRDGTPRDILDRVAECRAQGRQWFREVVMVVGRRGGKGFIGAVLFAWVLWWYLSLEDPQGHFGISRDKTLSGFVFASRKDQATANQYADIAGLLSRAPCFQPYIAEDRTGLIRLWSHAQLTAGETEVPRRAAFEISARDATPRGGRGPAAFFEAFDEMAHMQATGANRSASEIYDAAAPAVDQCRGSELIYSASSPWAQTGRFHANYLRSLQVDPGTGRPLNWDMVTFHLPSWDLYEGWERTGPDGIEVAPGRGPFPRLSRAIQEYDEVLEREERANPETFAVERRAEWATSPDAYLDGQRVSDAFGPWRGAPLQQKQDGPLGTAYYGHADPSTVGANFAVAIAHLEQPEDEELPHIVFDHLHAWRPRDFPQGRIWYPYVEEQLAGLLERFRLRQLTFDQYNSASTIDSLTEKARATGISPVPLVFLRSETRDRNWETAETFKRALNLGQIHLPAHDLAEAELRFLQVDDRKVHAPATGEVRTSDIADCIMAVTAELLGRTPGAHRALSEFKPQAIDGRGLTQDHPYSQQFSAFSQAGSRAPEWRNPARGKGFRY